MIYSLCFVFAVSFLSLFGFVSNSSATSRVITCNTLSCYNNDIRKVHDSSSVGFSFSYVSIEVQADKSLTNWNVGSFYNNTNKFIFINSSGYAFDLFSVTDSYFKVASNWNGWINNDTLPFSLTLTFYDSFPLVPCTCPTCPDIPENPYDDKLDKIYNAIIIGSATMLVIYFFYVMYSWYMGGRS